jgi:predicted site-specific integrase-resolvase
MEHHPTSSAASAPLAFEEQHFPVAYWARRWGFSAKTVRDWFRDENGPGILRQPNTGRRLKRDYTTIMISTSAAARMYAKRTAKGLIH